MDVAALSVDGEEPAEAEADDDNIVTDARRFETRVDAVGVLVVDVDVVVVTVVIDDATADGDAIDVKSKNKSSRKCLSLQYSI